MAIIPPIAGEALTVEKFGKPVVDEVNRMSPGVARAGATRTGPLASLPGNAYTAITWSTTSYDSGGFVSGVQNIVIPAGKDGIYAVTCIVYTGGANTNSYISLYAATVRYDWLSNGNGLWVGSLPGVPLVAGQTVYVMMWNGNAMVALTSGYFHVYRVSI